MSATIAPENDTPTLVLFPARATYWPAFTAERVFRAPVEKVWKMWTTKEGLDKWYWPPPFVARTRLLDLRPGGAFEIAADGLGHTARGTYTEVVPMKRLGMIIPIDFIPGVAPYDRVDLIEFHPTPEGHTRLTFTGSRMHSEEWQRLSKGGWSASLDKLERALATDKAFEGGFTIERTFKAAPERVWDMWTTKEGIEKWWVPSMKDIGFDMRVISMDVRVGGGFAFGMKNAEHDLVNRGTYTLVQPHWELGWAWHFDIFLGPGEKPYDVPIFVAFEKTPTGGTRMLFTQGPLATPGHTEGSRQGVMRNFAMMAKALGE